MFLHAAEFSAEHPATHARLTIKSQLPKELKSFLDKLDEIQQKPH
jgi:hypothetical protein